MKKPKYPRWLFWMACLKLLYLIDTSNAQVTVDNHIWLIEKDWDDD